MTRQITCDEFMDSSRNSNISRQTLSWIWDLRACVTRNVAEHRGSPLDSVLLSERELAQCSEIQGGPWNLSYSAAANEVADATGLPTLWPLSETVLRSALQG